MKQKSIKIIYWIFTILFAAFMIFSGVSELVQTEQGNQVLTDLGYPLYLNLILGAAKILGAIALIVPQFKIIKEWAYAGFTFDILGASASFVLNGDGFAATVMPLIFLVIMFVSYVSWKKMKD